MVIQHSMFEVGCSMFLSPFQLFSVLAFQLFDEPPPSVIRHRREASSAKIMKHWADPFLLPMKDGPLRAFFLTAGHLADSLSL